MCTAVHYESQDGHYFGRNLDLEYSYAEQVVVTPRNFPFRFRNGCELKHHHAMIGMATVSEGYPLYYEATNELGLSIAGLNFPGNATYLAKVSGKENITPFELIPWILSQCASITEAKDWLQKINLWNLPFSRKYPLSPLHWMIADSKECIVAEPMPDGLRIYDNPVGVLTNNPPFPYHLHHLADYRMLSAKQPENHFCQRELTPYSNGMGAIGLPGDFSSASRFIKAAFVKENSVTETDGVNQFFHILSSVSMPRGSIVMDDGRYEITRYSSCCDTQNAIYYYTTYANSRITAIDMKKLLLQSEQLITYPLRESMDIYFEN